MSWHLGLQAAAEATRRSGRQCVPKTLRPSRRPIAIAHCCSTLTAPLQAAAGPTASAPTLVAAGRPPEEEAVPDQDG